MCKARNIDNYITLRYLIGTMKLLSQVSREHKGKKYYKHWVVIPNKLVEKLGWKAGEDLEAYTEKGRLIIKKD